MVDIRSSAIFLCSFCYDVWSKKILNNNYLLQEINYNVILIPLMLDIFNWTLTYFKCVYFIEKILSNNICKELLNIDKKIFMPDAVFHLHGLGVFLVTRFSLILFYNVSNTILFNIYIQQYSNLYTISKLVWLHSIKLWPLFWGAGKLCRRQQIILDPFNS